MTWPWADQDDKDNPDELWHLRHWLQCWQLRTWIHDYLCYLTIKSDTGQHSQFLRCFFLKAIFCLQKQLRQAINIRQLAPPLWKSIVLFPEIVFAENVSKVISSYSSSKKNLSFVLMSWLKFCSKLACMLLLCVVNLAFTVREGSSFHYYGLISET